MLPELPSLYWYLALARIILVLLPQSGYIHPDEFFQSVEIQAGRVFEVEHVVPWEFNSTFPIRSLTIPYLTIGMVYRLAVVFDYFCKDFLNFSLVTPYFVVVGPRLLMCALSFLVDATMYRICINNNEKYKSKLVILASSYVMIVYGTHTFSNSIELVLFALLQYYVCESLTFSNTLIKKREYLNYRYETSRSVVEKVKFHKLRLFLTSDSLRNCWQISTITVMGFFNRPTFLAFALFPVFFWLYRGIGNKLIAPMNYHLRIAILILCSIPAILFNILVDSLYYGYLTWGEVGVLQVNINNFIFTPLNFVKYNIDSSNLAKHGLHPRFLHILVNMPLLFNILALFTFCGFVQAAYNFAKGRHQLLPTVRSIKGLMMLSYVAPLLILSIFPHQEPRFLIPLIVPLIYLHSSDILPEKDNILIKLEHVVKKPKTSTKTPTNVYMKLWLVVNAVLVIFFGFLHQGGVYKAANFLSKDMRVGSLRNEYYIVTSHIYSLPESLFLQKSSDKLRYSKSTKYTVTKRYFLHEEGSADLDVLVKDIKTIYRRIEDYKQVHKTKRRYKLFLIIPSSLEDQFRYLAANSQIVLEKVRTFYPHISTEAFPELAQDFFYLYSNFKWQEFQTSLLYGLSKIVSSFGLILYEIKIY